MFALSDAHRYPAQVLGVVLLDSMHPHQSNAFAGMDGLLAGVPVLARTGLADLFFDPGTESPQRRHASSSAMSPRCRPSSTRRRG